MAPPSKKTKAALGAGVSPGRRGRPTVDRAQAIDASIRAAALDIFLEAGFGAASMDAIAVKAPVSKGTLYARYESKHQLFRAVIEEELERLSKKAGEKDHLLPPEVEGRLRHHARIIAEILDWPQFRAIDRLMQSVRAFPEFDNLWQRLVTVRYVRFLSEDMALAADTRTVPREECHFLANLFFHSIMGWHRSEADQRTVPPEELLVFADRVIETIMLVIRQCRDAGASGSGDDQSRPGLPDR